MTTEEKFKAAVNVIRGLPKNGSYQPSHDLMLRFYAYFKQATEGPNPYPKPSFWEVIKKAKWEAWMKLGNMSKEQAMQAYIDELNKIVETMAYTENVAEFMTGLDNFYANVPIEDVELCIGPTIKKVRSQPGSPFANTPAGSNESTPTKVRNIDHDQSDLSDDEAFLDTMDVPVNASHPEPPIHKAIGHSVESNLNNHVSTKLSNGFIPNHHTTSATQDVFLKAVENLQKNYNAIDGRMTKLESRMRQVSVTRKSTLFGGLPFHTVAFFLSWPIVVNLLMHWLRSKKRTS